MPVYDPAQYDTVPVRELLDAAARGYIGVDRRMVRSILARGPSASAEALVFAREPVDAHRIDLDSLLVDLFRHWGTAEAVDYYMTAVRRHAEDLSDELIQAMLPLREQAVGPLLDLYSELGEEESGDVAFLLAGLQLRDPRILQVLLDRLQFDAADGAFLLGLYGDPAAREPLEAMLAEIPKDETELRREIEYALSQLGREMEEYTPEPFDPLAGYEEIEPPVFEVLSESERGEMLASPDHETRALAARCYFNRELDPKTRKILIGIARADPAAAVRGEAWASLADAAEDSAVRAEMLTVLSDAARDPRERGGAAVGLHGFAEQDEIRAAIEKLYEEGGYARAKALEAMWRSLAKPFADFFPAHVNDPDKKIARQALRGAGYFQMSAAIDKIAAHFADDSEDGLREDALFAYALAMPGETTRGRVRGMLRKIDSIAHLNSDEADTVMFALDERLRLKGLEPVFENESEDWEEEPEPERSAPKPGRNDPCPCGSGKKFKKCHGRT